MRNLFVHGLVALGVLLGASCSSGTAGTGGVLEASGGAAGAGGSPSNTGGAGGTPATGGSNSGGTSGGDPTSGSGGSGMDDAGMEAASSDDGGPTISTGGMYFPTRFAAPYVEVWNDNDLASIANTTSHKFFTLAFIINGNGTCNPMWNGDTCLTCNGYGNSIDKLRGMGGDVIISFGGAGGTEVGRSCTTVDALQAAYQKVIDQFHLTWMDLDIENGAEKETDSVDRRNQALHNLQMANPGLNVSYTLAVDRTGLPKDDLNVLKSAKAAGVRVDVVNVMAMDFGPCYTDMGQAAIDSASATRDQLSAMGLAASVGVTPQIGTNDPSCETFSTTNAQELVTFAQANDYVRLLAFWALDSDKSYSNLQIFHTLH